MSYQTKRVIVFIVRNTLDKIILVNVLKNNTSKEFRRMMGELRLFNHTSSNIYSIEVTTANDEQKQLDLVH